MSDQSSATHSLKPSAAAAYIAEMAGGLAAMARRQGFDALSYLLDMARLEAETLSVPTSAHHADREG